MGGRFRATSSNPWSSCQKTRAEAWTSPAGFRSSWLSGAASGSPTILSFWAEICASVSASVCALASWRCAAKSASSALAPWPSYAMDLHMPGEHEVSPAQLRSRLSEAGARLLVIPIWNHDEARALAASYGALALLDSRGDVLRQPRHQYGAVLYLLLDVRFSARRGLHLCGR